MPVSHSVCIQQMGLEFEKVWVIVWNLNSSEDSLEITWEDCFNRCYCWARCFSSLLVRSPVSWPSPSMIRSPKIMISLKLKHGIWKLSEPALCSSAGTWGQPSSVWCWAGWPHNLIWSSAGPPLSAPATGTWTWAERLWALLLSLDQVT